MRLLRKLTSSSIFLAGALASQSATVPELPAIDTPATNDLVIIHDTSDLDGGALKQATIWQLLQSWIGVFLQAWDADLDTVANRTGGNATNYLAGDGTFKAVANSSITGLAADLATKQNADPQLDTVANLAGGTAGNFLAGDGTFKNIIGSSSGNSNSVLVTDSNGVVSGLQGANGQELVDNGAGPVWQERYDIANGDWWAEGIASTVTTMAFAPMLGAAIGAGVNAQASGIAEHPSLWSLSPAGIGTGYSYITRASETALAGLEKSTFIFRVSNTNIVVRLGFIDTSTATDPVDGAYVAYENSHIFGRTFSNSVGSVTVTSNYIDAANTYYSAVTSNNVSSSVVSFYLLSDNGAVVWTDTLSSSIPAAASRALGVGITLHATVTNTGAMLNLDAVGFKRYRRLIR